MHHTLRYVSEGKEVFCEVLQKAIGEKREKVLQLLGVVSSRGL